MYQNAPGRKKERQIFGRYGRHALLRHRNVRDRGSQGADANGGAPVYDGRMSRVLQLRTALRAGWQRLRGGELSPRRAAASVGVGIFVGCFPLYGLQTLLCVGLT